MDLESGSLWLYEGSYLQAFNETTTHSWVYVKLMISLGDEKDILTINWKLLVVPFRSIYNCILGRPYTTILDNVASLVDLKLKYHILQGKLVTINVDLEG